MYSELCSVRDLGTILDALLEALDPTTLVGVSGEDEGAEEEDGQPGGCNTVALNLEP